MLCMHTKNKKKMNLSQKLESIKKIQKKARFKNLALHISIYKYLLIPQ